MEEITRAAAAKKTGTKKTGTKKKTTTSKKTTAKKKTTSSGTMKLSAAEKELVKNYRKCNKLEKKVISTLCEKASGGLEVFGDLLSSLLGQL